MLNQNRDRSMTETQGLCVAGALPANPALQPSLVVRGERNSFEIGDQTEPATHVVNVASAEPTIAILKSRMGLSAPAPFPIGDHAAVVTQYIAVPAAARAKSLVQPIDNLRGRRSFPQIGGQCGHETQTGCAPGERSTRNLVKPQIELSSARAFPEIGRQTECDRHAPRQWFVATQMIRARLA